MIQPNPNVLMHKHQSLSEGNFQDFLLPKKQGTLQTEMISREQNMPVWNEVRNQHTKHTPLWH